MKAKIVRYFPVEISLLFFGVFLSTVCLLIIGGLGRALPDSNPLVEFEVESPVVQQAPAQGKWPRYGYNFQRTHAFKTEKMGLPGKALWSFRSRVLLEFTPSVCNGIVYLLRNNGSLIAFNASDGKERFRIKLGQLAASSPTCAKRDVYVTLLSSKKDKSRGKVVKLNRRGKIVWERLLQSRSESSPLLHKGQLVFGTESGEILSLNARDGSTNWRYQAKGAVKAGLAFEKGAFYVGDYGGFLHAISTEGKRKWAVDTAKPFREGNIYATPSISYGRVYISSTDGSIQSFSRRTGQRAWRIETDDYVYAAVALGGGDRPTAYVGGYDGIFRALNARTGQERWAVKLGAKISGAASLIGETVWVSELDSTSSYGLRASDGFQRKSYNRGGFQTAISDGERLYLMGYSSMFVYDLK
jgi:outer membrane protein assembly factor BamB